MACEVEARTFPLKRPRGHKVPVPRWSLKFPDTVTHIYTLYVGVQCHCENKAARERVEDLIQAALSGGSKPPAIDTFRVTAGFDLEVYTLPLLCQCLTKRLRS